MDIVRSRRSRTETSPDRAKVSMQPNPKPIQLKKVQVVYYLSRNGHLEHPHYIQVTHLSNHRLRLRDVMDRLTVLRGKAMPSLYSWSCKRSYKNGYVWNDLGDNDVIYPSDGAEYVLKGSELLDGCSERFEQHQIGNNRQIIQEPSLHAKGKHHIGISQHKQLGETQTSKLEFEEYMEQDAEEEEESESQEEYELDEEKTSCYTSSTTPHSRCSRGVSTDDPSTELSPPNPSIKPDPPINTSNINMSKRFEDGDPFPTTRNSVLLQLISCGNLPGARPKDNNNNVPNLKQEAMRKSESNLHKGVLYKTAVKVADQEGVMIRYMSENPRFGNLQSEDKEYFSGSIVESMRHNPVVDDSLACLKRSNSYNEERSQKEANEGEKEEDMKDKTGRGKCIPRKVLSSSKQTKK
ncbi:hypothetical protein M5689_013296 [Euphorbia peplus]|nr:hypothetical protein M5689_013296 [Euphorbia peplus]